MADDTVSQLAQRIIAYATPHPEDTDEDRRRYLRHIVSIATALLAVEETRKELSNG